jgi:uncharacterized protein YcfJ
LHEVILMKTPLTVLASLLLAAGSAAAQQGYYEPTGYPPQDDYYEGGAEEAVSYGFADVLRADPIYDFVRINQPREMCRTERTYAQRDNNNGTGGAILGALIGGALGNQAGKGDGRKAATIAGAVVGGVVGSNIDRNNGIGPQGYATNRCRVVDNYVEEQRLMGYNVEYRYKGDIYTTRLNYDPGRRMRVRVTVTPEA